SAALWLRLWIGLVIVAASLILSSIATSTFRIPPDMNNPAGWAIRLTGISFAVTLTFGVFGGVLAALNRFDLLSAVNMGQTVLRASGVVWLLKSGHGIVGLAVWELLVALLANIALAYVSFRFYPELRVLFQ